MSENKNDIDFYNKYLGFCSKYGMGKMFALGLAAPVALNSLVMHFRGADYLYDSTLTALGGAVGFVFGTYARPIAGAFCRASRKGLTEGGQIVRRAQAIAYVIPVAGAMTLSACSDIDPFFMRPVEPKQDYDHEYYEDPSASLDCRGSQAVPITFYKHADQSISFEVG